MSKEVDYIDEKQKLDDLIILKESEVEKIDTIEELEDSIAVSSIENKAETSCDFIEIKREIDFSQDKIKEIEVLENEVERLKFFANQNVELNIEIDSIKTEIKKKELEKTSYNEKISELKNLNEVYIKQIAEVNDELDKLAKDDTLKKELKENKKKIKEISAQLNSVEKNILNVEEEKEKLEKEIDRKNKKIITLDKKKEKLEKESEEKNIKLVDLNSRIIDLEKENLERNQENEVYERQLNEQKTINKEQKERLKQELKETTEKLTLTIDDLATKLEFNDSNFIRGNKIVNDTIEKLDVIFSHKLKRDNKYKNMDRIILNNNMNIVIGCLVRLRRYYIGVIKELNSKIEIKRIQDSLDKILEIEIEIETILNMEKNNGERQVDDEERKLLEIKKEIEKLNFKGE